MLTAVKKSARGRTKVNSKVVLEAREEAEAVRKSAAGEVKQILAFADLNADRRSRLVEALEELLADIGTGLAQVRSQIRDNGVDRLKGIAGQFGIDALFGALRRVDTGVETAIDLRFLATDAAAEIQTDGKIESIVGEMKTLKPTAVADLFAKMSDAGVIPAIPAPRAEASKSAVVLVEPGLNKINCIKAIREVTSLGLKEAKDLVDAAAGSRQTLTAGLTREEAERIVGKFAEFGATVEIAKAPAAD
jgi:large subunit ribosomal protein L7/L12